MQTRNHTLLLTAIAALGGLLYGYDIGIIGTALLYLDKCIPMTENQVGLLASAIMIGQLASSIVGGSFADLMGRKKAMIVSALLFVASVVLIVTAPGFLPLFLGRTLQGLSAGMIAVVVPIFMSECLPAKNRGTGATMFQLCITLGIMLSMSAGAYYQSGVEEAAKTLAGDAKALLAVQDHAWRHMFQSSMYPAVLFFFVAMFVSESPRWLFRRGRKEKALAVLLKSRPKEMADLELGEMEALAAASKNRAATAAGDSIWQRHYIQPLILACVLLGINQATGICAVITFAIKMISQSGLSESFAAHSGIWLTLTNFLVTIVGVLLVDRTGRKFLLKLGTLTIIIALAVGVFVYWQVESGRVDVSAKLQNAVSGNTLTMNVADLAPGGEASLPVQVNVLYAYGGQQQMKIFRSDAKNPVLLLKPGEKDKPDAKLEILRAKFSKAPSKEMGYVIFACLIVYITGFAVGPGVCLWLMSAELLPTRVRSIGMGVGVLLNALVTIGTTACFLPVVGNWGYAAMWAIWLGCTTAYFLFATFLLPETKGKTLEEIEEHFAK
jgi:SP family myo-inositol transporter-like MFS transporter 13